MIIQSKHVLEGYGRYVGRNRKQNNFGGLRIFLKNNYDAYD